MNQINGVNYDIQVFRFFSENKTLHYGTHGIILNLRKN